MAKNLKTTDSEKSYQIIYDIYISYMISGEIRRLMKTVSVTSDELKPTKCSNIALVTLNYYNTDRWIEVKRDTSFGVGIIWADV